ncbi:hypothetical protein BCON_0119g00410 [Botryotinia convoluta]|uniref:Heterokaryon incompatibility domain-containing protein n=1 Tax=Botryotinia convoluta TaxID=54673 RepID=A0A4Z1IAM6_9HELO|nr:hypothetical protein BCON_0119g00410 [Botryotinia convoluta]
MLEPLRVNFDFLRLLLNACLEDHEECQSTKVEIAKLRVIEVTTKRICQAPKNCEYIALSYVWGDNSTCKSTQGEFPSVVQDAFAATEALGYQYLWVDRYCIGQNPNSPHMQSTINQMDLVYSNARATIVAASGSSASDGLPGISDPRYQAHAVVGKTNLIEVTNVVVDIMLSNWATRGWTYQEWYFSKRRLIFTDSEVMFLCNEKMVKETALGHDTYEIEDMEHEFESMKPRSHIKAHLLHFYDLESHIKGYSKRNLSHDCDILNAFAGVLRYYESVALVGHAEEEEVLFDLLWDHEAIAHRRDDLPSWSWSVWGDLAANKPLDNSTDENERATSAERVLRIQIPLDDRTIDLDSFCRERQLNLHREMYPKELHITSFIMPLRFRKVPRPGEFLGIPVCFDREYNFELHKLGLVLPIAGQFYKEPDVYSIIVLHPVADGKYERAGLLTLQYDVDTGDIETCGSSAWWGVSLDENDNPIPDGDYEYTNPRNEASNDLNTSPSTKANI